MKAAGGAACLLLVLVRAGVGEDLAELEREIRSRGIGGCTTRVAHEATVDVVAFTLRRAAEPRSGSRDVSIYLKIQKFPTTEEARRDLEGMSGRAVFPSEKFNVGEIEVMDWEGGSVSFQVSTYTVNMNIQGHADPRPLISEIVGILEKHDSG